MENIGVADAAAARKKAYKLMATGILFGSVLLFGWAGYLAFDEIAFSQRATKTLSKVVQISKVNDLCRGSGRNNSSYDCTRFSASVVFTDTNGSDQTEIIPAGDVSGIDRDISAAIFKQGEMLEILYVNMPDREVRVADWNKRYILPCVFALAGILDLFIGVFFMLWSKRIS